MEMNMGKFSEKLVGLLELAKKKKNVLEYQEISDYFKDQPLDAEQMDKIFDFLEASGVDVLRITENSADDLMLDDDMDIDGLDDEEEVELDKIDLSVPEGVSIEDPVRMYLKDKQVYAKAKYTVDTATEVDDSTFGVKVTVEPLDVFDRVAEALWGDTPDARAEALYSQDVDSMTDEEYAAYDAEWCRLVIDLTLEKLPEAEYLEAQSKVVQITLGDDNYWSLDEQDFSDLDWLILDYNF